MSELNAETSGDVLTITFDETLYPKDAIYGAAYIFIDRCYLHLDRTGDGKISITLRRKAHVKLEVDALAGEFENELLGQAWRRMITEENRELIQQITTRAMAGAAGPPGLDDLLTFEADAGAFEDPLGIAMSWEEKYKKKTPASPENTDGASGATDGTSGKINGATATDATPSTGGKPVDPAVAASPLANEPAALTPAAAPASSQDAIAGTPPIATPAVASHVGAAAPASPSAGSAGPAGMGSKS